MLGVDARTWYAGTPEVDRFQRDEPGQVLLVDLEPGREPTVTPVRTGKFQWLKRSWTVNDEAAFAAECEALLASIEPAATLIELTLAGITNLSDRVVMLSRLETDIEHRLRYLDLRAADLVGRPGDDDLAALAVEGMLGAAAAKLTAVIDTGSAEGGIARRALERLFVEYAREDRA